MNTLKIQEWDDSYQNGDNFVWLPHEEVIRFVSKYIKKRIDIHKFKVNNSEKKILDFGCGVGRHVFFLDDMELEPWGIDISSVAINKAKEWAAALNKMHLIEKLKLVNGEPPLPFSDRFFTFVVSHGVFDSMPFTVARENIMDIARIMKDGGLFYLDLVSGDDDKHSREYEAEEIVTTEHEKGTIQSYFNYRKVRELISGSGLVIEEAILIKRENIFNKGINSRYHLILKRVSQ